MVLQRGRWDPALRSPTAIALSSGACSRARLPGPAQPPTVVLAAPPARRFFFLGVRNAPA